MVDDGERYPFESSSVHSVLLQGYAHQKRIAAPPSSGLLCLLVINYNGFLSAKEETTSAPQTRPDHNALPNWAEPLN